MIKRFRSFFVLYVPDQVKQDYEEETNRTSAVKLRSISTYCGMCKSKPCIHPLLVLLPEPRQGYSQVLVSSIAVGFGLRITGMSLFRRLCSHVQPNDVKDPFHPQGCLLLGLLRFHPTLAADTATQNPRIGLIRSRSSKEILGFF